MTQALDEPTRLAMRAALEALDERLSTLLTNTESAAQQVPLKENASRLSRIDEMHNQSILRANRTVTKNRLMAIQKAFARIEDGTYGTCLECLEPIALPRLHAYPEASLCLACKAAGEASS